MRQFVTFLSKWSVLLVNFFCAFHEFFSLAVGIPEQPWMDFLWKNLSYQWNVWHEYLVWKKHLAQFFRIKRDREMQGDVSLRRCSSCNYPPTILASSLAYSLMQLKCSSIFSAITKKGFFHVWRLTFCFIVYITFLLDFRLSSQLCVFSQRVRPQSYMLKCLPYICILLFQ